jgi:hypothetical protein
LILKISDNFMNIFKLCKFIKPKVFNSFNFSGVKKNLSNEFLVSLSMGVEDEGIST